MQQLELFPKSYTVIGHWWFSKRDAEMKFKEYKINPDDPVHLTILELEMDRILVQNKNPYRIQEVVFYTDNYWVGHN